MNTGPLNRGLFAAGGLLFLACGAAIGIIGQGAVDLFGLPEPGRPVITPDIRQMLMANHTWVWGTTAAVSVLFVLIGLFWLLSQLRSERLVRMDLEPDRGDGYLRLSVRALTDAVTRDVQTVHGVQGAAARLVDRRGKTELHLVLRLSARADVSEVREHVENVALPHAQQVLAPDPLPSRVRLEVARSTGHRVR